MPEPLCPHCHVPQIYVRSSLPWCERCEYGLDAFKPEPEDGPVGRRLTVWSKRLAYRANSRQYAAIAGQELKRPGLTPAFLVLLGISVLLVASALGLLAFAGWLIGTGSVVQKALGLLLVGVVLVLRPRLGRLKTYRDKYDEISRPEAPELFSLIDEAAKVAGARAPDHVFVGTAFNAFAAVVGLRRKRVLMIGIPLWLSLQPQERIAVLGHELGHFLNRDVRRGLLTQPACTMFGQLADLVQPGRVYADGSPGGLLATLGMAIGKVFMYAAYYVLFALHVAMNALSLRDGQRAEYYADTIAAKLAGPAAATSLEVLVRAEMFQVVLGGRARAGAGFTDWQKAASETRNGVDLPKLWQLSLREEASAFATHPPTGLRYRLLSSLPPRQPTLVLTPARAERIDAELGRFEKRYANDVAHAW